jgi:hypothetical protein
MDALVVGITTKKVNWVLDAEARTGSSVLSSIVPATSASSV